MTPASTVMVSAERRRRSSSTASSVSTYVDRAMYEPPARQARLHELPPGFSARRPRRQPDGRLVDYGEAHGVRRTATRTSWHVSRFVPRQPGIRRPDSKAPACADCHLPHNTLATNTAAFRESEVALCGRCHRTPRRPTSTAITARPSISVASAPPCARTATAVTRSSRHRTRPARIQPEHRGHLLQVPPGRQPQLRRASSCTSIPAAPVVHLGLGLQPPLPDPHHRGVHVRLRALGPVHLQRIKDGLYSRTAETAP